MLCDCWCPPMFNGKEQATNVCDSNQHLPSHYHHHPSRRRAASFQPIHPPTPLSLAYRTRRRMRKRGSKELGRSPYIDFRPVGLLDFFLAVTRLAHLRAVNRTERFFQRNLSAVLSRFCLYLWLFNWFWSLFLSVYLYFFN